MYPRMIRYAITMTISICPAVALAQAATAGAEFNKKERAWIAENERLKEYDKPIYPDPLGNALIGGAATGALKGVPAAVGAAARGGAVGTAIEGAKRTRDDSKGRARETSFGKLPGAVK